jgi:hypothetical protein
MKIGVVEWGPEKKEARRCGKPPVEIIIVQSKHTPAMPVMGVMVVAVVVLLVRHRAVRITQQAVEFQNYFENRVIGGRGLFIRF